MIVLRGPKQSPGYPQTTLVDKVDLSKEKRAWTETRVLTFNISKEQASARKSQVHLWLTEDDVIALYHGLVRGWRNKIKAEERKRTRAGN